MSTSQTPPPASPWNAPSGSAYPGGSDLPPQVRRPGTVEAAFWIYLVSGVLTLALTLLVFTQAGKQAIQNAVRQSGSTQNMSEDQLVQTAQIVAVAAAVIGLAIALLFAFKMRAGRNWARIVLTVFAVLSLLSLFGVRTGTSFTDFIGPIVSLVALVLMWLPASNEYFAAAKRRRAAEIARG